jgi:hypothetical protein
MCQACVILASRRAGAAAPAGPALGSRQPVRFAAVAEWAETPADRPPADEPVEAPTRPAIDADRG